MKKVKIIVGPTASGKSGYAHKFMVENGGAIINADSLQVYDALPLLIASPQIEPQYQDGYHLYGFLNPNETCSAGKWLRAATKVIDDVHLQGDVPIVVGGTGLYIKALLGGLAAMPEIDEALREKINHMSEEEVSDALFKHDKIAFENLKDKQRRIRALEVVLSTGKPLHKWQEEGAQTKPLYDFEMTFLNPPREVLYNRCNNRFLTMLEEGALAEVEAFEKMYPQDIAPKKALGYTEIAAFLKGIMTRDDMIQKAQQKTRNYAKRQVTWFRHQLPDNVDILTSF